MEINIQMLAIFFAGILAQAFLMMAGQWKTGDMKATALSFATGLLGLLPGRHERNYDIGFHLLIVCVGFVVIFTACMRDRLVATIGARSLIILNVILISVVYAKWGFTPIIIELLAVPTIITLLNGFTDLDKDFGWQVFMYVWYVVMLVAIALFSFSFYDLKQIFWGGSNSVLTSASALVLGSSFFYIVSNAWFALALLPYKPKNKTMADRMIEIREHMQLLAYGYVWEGNDKIINFVVFIILLASIGTNMYFKYLNSGTLVVIILAILPLINKVFGYQVPQADNVGQISSKVIKN